MRWKDRLKKKSTWIIAICLIGVVVFAGRSLAAYTSQAFQRGVARNQDSETVRFTSNLLQNCAAQTDEAKYVGRTVLFSENEKNQSTLSIDLDIYNYANGNTNLVSQKDITYNLIIAFSNGTGTAADYTVTNQENLVTFQGETVANKIEFTTENGKTMTLTGRSANEHHFVLKFPAKDLDTVKITVTAIPTNVSVTNNQILAGVIAPCTSSGIKEFHAEGKFVDESQLVTPEAYDGFNYEVSISSGTATATLSWNTEIVEIDPFFLKKIGQDKSAEQIQKDGKVTFTMDQSQESGDYLIPFYIVDKEKIPKTWDEMKKIITFSAEETKQ